VPDLWPAAAAQGHYRGNTGINNSGSWSFQDTVQLHLYTNLKNLRLQKHIDTGTKNPLQLHGKKSQEI
jgi:hypothetical protein